MAEELKEKGNQLFAAGKYSQAAEFYSNALEQCEKGNQTILSLYKNRAACFLKLVCIYQTNVGLKFVLFKVLGEV
jgi:hypothetical protein